MMRTILGIVLILALGTVIMAEEAFDVTKIDKYMQVGKADETGLAWLDPWEAPFQLSGMYRFSNEKKFQRIPQEMMEGLRPGLLNLAKCTTGFQLRFRSNTTRINLAVSVPKCKQSALQPQAGQYGFDLYVDGVYWSLTQVTDNTKPYKFELGRVLLRALRGEVPRKRREDIPRRPASLLSRLPQRHRPVGRAHAVGGLDCVSGDAA